MLISNAWAQGAPAAGIESSLMSFLPIILMFVVLYFLMIRPQMKRQKELKAMLESLKVGDEVVTAAGLLGTLSKIGEQYVTVHVADAKDGPIELIMQRGAIQTLLPKNTIKGL